MRLKPSLERRANQTVQTKPAHYFFTSFTCDAGPAGIGCANGLAFGMVGTGAGSVGD